MTTDPESYGQDLVHIIDNEYSVDLDYTAMGQEKNYESLKELSDSERAKVVKENLEKWLKGEADFGDKASEKHKDFVKKFKTPLPVQVDLVFSVYYYSSEYLFPRNLLNPLTGIDHLPLVTVSPWEERVQKNKNLSNPEDSPE